MWLGIVELLFQKKKKKSKQQPIKLCLFLLWSYSCTNSGICGCVIRFAHVEKGSQQAHKSKPVCQNLKPLASDFNDDHMLQWHKLLLYKQFTVSAISSINSPWETSAVSVLAFNHTFLEKNKGLTGKEEMCWVRQRLFSLHCKSNHWLDALFLLPCFPDGSKPPVVKSSSGFNNLFPPIFSLSTEWEKGKRCYFQMKQFSFQRQYDGK